ncbi:hypothetical protein [Nocardia sp. NPDC046763]|uniref:hypothetical protein n=1 Tax=Nocardia sp. NPDC046763 TaxID=3155256 RepID=UPI0033FF4430
MSTIPVQPSWVVGQQVNAAALNAIPNGLAWLYQSRPVCTVRAASSLTTSLPNQTWTTVQMNTVDADTDSGFSTSTSLYTCATAGWYFVMGCGVFQTPASNTGSRAIRFALNGNPVAGIAAHPPSNYNAGVSLQRTVYMGRGDTLALQAFQDCGSTISTGANGTEYPFMSLFFYGA